MKHYRITAIVETDNDERIYKLDNVTGMFRSQDGANVLIHPNILICNEGFSIHSIKDNNREVEFKLGDHISFTPDFHGKLILIKYANKEGNQYDIKLFIVSDKGIHNTLSITDCKHYVKEESMPVKKNKTAEEVVENKSLMKVRELEAKIIKDFNGKVLKFGKDNEGNKFIRKKIEGKDEFMKKFFERNAKYETIHPGNGHTQNVRGARRSLGDIYMIVKYYYPKCTLESILPYFYGNTEQRIPNMISQFCQGTQKRVYRPKAGNNPIDYHPEKTNEYGHLNKVYEEAIK